MLLPIGDDNPRTRTPYVHYTIMGLNVLVQLWLMFQPAESIQETYLTLGLVPDRISPSTLYMFITSMFLHGGILHLAGNMLFLWIVGDNVEDKLGHAGYLAFYLAAGVLADVLHIATTSDPGMPLIGASGAVSGVLGAYLVFFPRNDIKILLVWLPFVRVFRVRAGWAIGFWFAEQILYWLVTEASGATSVAYGAHVGGFVLGVAVALVLSRTGILPAEVFHSPLDTTGHPNRARAVAKIAPPPVQPAEVEPRIRQALAAGEFERSSDLYLALRFTPGGHVLSPEVQLGVADGLSRLGLHRFAVEAYRAYVDRYPQGEGASRALVALARIHGRDLADYDTALAYVRRAKKSGLAGEDRKALEELEQSVTSHLGRVAPEGEEPQALASVIRKTDEKVFPGRLGRIIQEFTGEPISDVTRRFTRGRGLVASGLSGAKAADLARRLAAAGLPVLVVDEDRMVGLPDFRRAVALDLGPERLFFRFENGETIEKPWTDVFMIVGAWIEESVEAAYSRPGREMVVGTRGGIYMSNYDPGKLLRPKASRLHAVLDFLAFSPWSRIRLRGVEFSFQGRPVNLRRMAWLLLRHGKRVAMNEGIYVMADRGNVADYTFARPDHLDEYERWLLQLEEFNRAK
ncbi:MAG: rhomboid family intramembrane serine protease [Planctomycetes bacterium]|nr:rhomboid family intramembrane serine protease [Planctomycetota bacterium]